MWHVRILSEPKFSIMLSAGSPSAPLNSPQHAVLTATFPLTLTTDLSDAYYPLSATLHAQFLTVGACDQELEDGPETRIQWLGANVGKRVLKCSLHQTLYLQGTQLYTVERESQPSRPFNKVILRISAVASPRDDPSSQQASTLVLSVPEFLDLWTTAFELILPAHLQNASTKPISVRSLYEGEHWLQRRIIMPKGSRVSSKDIHDENNHTTSPETDPNLDQPIELRILEEAGESIARHVWDGGIALACHFSKLVGSINAGTSGPGELYSKPNALRSLLEAHLESFRSGCCSRPLRLLELGAGCGTAGLALASLLPKSRTLLSDLPEALEIMQANVQNFSAINGFDTKVGFLELDWQSVVDNTSQTLYELESSVLEGQPDLIIVSECTYNEDTLSLLVETLQRLAIWNKTPIDAASSSTVVVARKPRHENEEAFFHMMEKYFELKEFGQILLQDRSKAAQNIHEEAVNVHVYRYRQPVAG